MNIATNIATALRTHTRLIHEDRNPGEIASVMAVRVIAPGRIERTDIYGRRMSDAPARGSY